MSPLSSKISGILEEEILAGTLAPGQRLPPEDKLASRFQSSRTVIREAIQQLRGRGLVHTRKGSGSYIADPSLATLSNAIEAFSVLTQGSSFLELMDFRILLETECARLAALHANDDMIHLMQRALDKMESSRGDPKRFSEADIAFHLAIAAASRHTLFATILTALRKRSLHHATRNHKDSGWFEEMIKTHQEIFDGVAAHRPDEAASCMKNHLLLSRRLALDWKD